MSCFTSLPVFKKITLGNGLNDDHLARLYVSASALADGVEVPAEFHVDFNQNEPLLGDLVSIPPEVFFPGATSFFINADKAKTALKKLDTKPYSIVGINVLVIRKLITDRRIESLSQYERYIECMKSFGAEDEILPVETFNEISDSMLYLILNTDNKKIYGNVAPDASSGCKRLAKGLKNKLRLTREQQIDFVFYVHQFFKKLTPPKGKKSYSQSQVESICDEIWPYMNFFQNYDNSDVIKKLVCQCIKDMEVVNNSLSVLQNIELYGRNSVSDSVKDESNQNAEDHSSYNSIKRYDPEELIYTGNNVLLECGLIVPQLMALLRTGLEKRSLVFIEPSYTLIDRWLRRSTPCSVPVLFVVSDNRICTLIQDYINTKSIKIREIVKCISHEELWRRPVPKNGEIIICSDAAKQDSPCWNRLSERKRRTNDSIILAIDSDDSLSAKDSLVAIEREYLVSLMKIPTGVEKEQNGKRCIWVSTNEMRVNVSVEFFAKAEKERKSTIRRIGIENFDKSVFFPPSGVPLRTHIESLLAEKKEKHSPKQFIMFSPTFKIYYSGFSEISLACNEKMKIYLRMQFLKTEANRAQAKFIPVAESTVSQYVGSLEEAEEFLYEKYPFYEKSFKRVCEDIEIGENAVGIETVAESEDIEPTKSKEKSKYIGQIVREKIDQYELRYPDTFRDFFFLFYDILLKKLREKELRILKDLAMNSNLSLQSLSNITPQLFELMFQGEEYTDEFYINAFSAFMGAFDVAVEYHILQKNEFRLLKNKKAEWQKLFARVRGLAKKTFSKEEFLKLYRNLRLQIDLGEVLRADADDSVFPFCMLFSLLTGLESYVVPAIKWRDITFKESGLCTVKIVRQFTSNGAGEVAIEDPYDYRILPAGRILTALLKDAKEDVDRIALENGVEKKAVREFYVVNSFCHNIEMMRRRLAPRKISEFEASVISSVLDIPELLVYVPDSRRGTKETDLSVYKGNLLRENFRFYASDIGNFDEDETAYFLGTMPISTAGLHYIDFRSEAMLLRLNVKLNRVCAFLEENEKRKERSNESIIDVTPDCIDIGIKTSGDCTVIASAPHGVEVRKEVK